MKTIYFIDGKIETNKYGDIGFKIANAKTEVIVIKMLKGSKKSKTLKTMLNLLELIEGK